MWALVKSNSVDTVYSRAIAVTINDLQYPKTIFALWSKSQRKAIGIYDIVRKDKPDNALYNVGTSSYTYNVGTDTVNENFTSTERNVSTLKISHTQLVQLRANDDLRRFSWLIERYVWDNTKTIPSSIKTYADAVRTHCSTITTAIDNCVTFADFKTVYTDIYDSGGAYYTWPSESGSVASYVRRDFK